MGPGPGSVTRVLLPQLATAAAAARGHGHFVSATTGALTTAFRSTRTATYATTLARNLPPRPGYAATAAPLPTCQPRPRIRPGSAAGFFGLGPRAIPGVLISATSLGLRAYSNPSNASPPPPDTTAGKPLASPGNHKDEGKDIQKEKELLSTDFKPSDRAAKAAKVNFAAKLSKEGKSQPDAQFRDIWRLARLARPELSLMVLSICLMGVNAAIFLALPKTFGAVVDAASKAKEDDEIRVYGLTVVQFGLSFFVAITVGALATYSRIYLLRIASERVVSRLRRQLYRHTLRQDGEFFDANRVGDLLSRFSTDCLIVAKSVAQNTSDGIRSGIFGLGGFGMMLYISPVLTAVLALVAPPVAAGAFFFGRFSKNINRLLSKNAGVLSKIGEERLGNIRTSQAFVGERLEMNRYNTQLKRIMALGLQEAHIQGLWYSGNSFISNGTILTMMVLGANMVHSGMPAGDLTSFLMYAVVAGSSIGTLSNWYNELMRGAGAATRLFELLDRKPTIPQTVGKRVTSAQGAVRFDNVTFAYPTRPLVTIFNGLSFEIPSGSNVCIVGPSGGGKSTIASLLLRFYKPTAGRITVNGDDISAVNLKSLRRRIGMVAQEPVLFSGTISQNISYGNPNATREEVIIAAKKANCTFIGDLPDGLDTEVGARGSQLSGGQKQRIAIARALIKDPDILILDEATSALDAESETLVNQALANLLEGHNTTISIAHRLSTIKRSDQIIVLNSDGRVAEMGSFTELSANRESAFAKLMDWQLYGGDIPDVQRATYKATEPGARDPREHGEEEEEKGEDGEHEEEHGEDHEESGGTNGHGRRQ